LHHPINETAVIREMQTFGKKESTKLYLILLILIGRVELKLNLPWLNFNIIETINNESLVANRKLQCMKMAVTPLLSSPIGRESVSEPLF